MSLDGLEAFDHHNRKPNSTGLNNKGSCPVVGPVLRWVNSVVFSRTSVFPVSLLCPLDVVFILRLAGWIQQSQASQ